MMTKKVNKIMFVVRNFCYVMVEDKKHRITVITTTIDFIDMYMVYSSKHKKESR